MTPSRFAAAERSTAVRAESTMLCRSSCACARVVGRSCRVSGSEPTRLNQKSWTRAAVRDRVAEPEEMQRRVAGQHRLRPPQRPVRVHRAEAEVVALDRRLPRVHVDREQHEHRCDPGAADGARRRPSGGAGTSSRRRSDREASVQPLVAGEEKHEQQPEREQRPRRRRGDRLLVLLRRVRERARARRRRRRRRAWRRSACSSGRRTAARSGPGCARASARAPRRRAPAGRRPRRRGR